MAGSPRLGGEAKTHEGYRYLLTRYVIPHIGRQRIQSLRPSTVSAMYRTLLAEGGVDGGPLSTRTVEYVHAVLRKAFNDEWRRRATPGQPRRARQATTSRLAATTGNDLGLRGASELPGYRG